VKSTLPPPSINVARERERASANAKKRYVAVDRALDLGHRVEDVM